MNLNYNCINYNLNAIITFKIFQLNVILNAVTQIQRNFEKVREKRKGLKQSKNKLRDL